MNYETPARVSFLVEAIMSITHLIWHYTESDDVPASVVDQWHKAKGWKGIGYHYLIRKNGNVEKGREESEVGAHCSGHNAGTLGISLCGSDTLEWYPTDAQYRAAGILGAELKRKYGLSVKDASTFHRDWMSTSCPGKLDRERLKAEMSLHAAQNIKPIKEENEMAVIGPGIEATKYGLEFYIGTPPGKTKSENVYVKVRNLKPAKAHVTVKAITNNAVEDKSFDLEQNKGAEVDVASLGVKGSTLVEVTSNAPVYISFDPR
jgi:hypothetical protein